MIVDFRTHLEITLGTDVDTILTTERSTCRPNWWWSKQLLLKDQYECFKLSHFSQLGPVVLHSEFERSSRLVSITHCNLPQDQIVLKCLRARSGPRWKRARPVVFISK